MRIVGGKHRSRPLYTPKDKNVRPTTDMMRESIFNIIQWEIKGAKFLDVFAGSGAMGLEAISRGAVSTFNDISKESIALIKKNLDYLKEKAEVYNQDYKTLFLRLKNHNKKFDFIFLDPPYGKFDLGDILEGIFFNDLLKDGGKVIYECPIEEKLPEPKNFTLVDQRKYGKSKINFYQKKERIALLTGSFDPVTKGHISLAEKGLDYFDKVVFGILINPDKKYLFTLSEREKILEKAISSNPRFSYASHDGWAYELAKEVGAESFLRGYRNEKDLEYEKEMQEYNLQFGIHTLILPAQENLADLSSTNVRKKLEEGEDISQLLPENTVDLVKDIYSRK